MMRLMRCTIFLITVISLPQSIYGAQIDLNTQVAQQVDRIRLISGYSEELFFELPGTTSPKGDSPVQELVKFGMGAIPYLIPYLSDASLTQAYRAHGSGRKKTACVNEYIIFAINKIAEHNFYLPLDRDNVVTPGATLSPFPKDIEELQSQIQSWWEENRTKSLLERKMEDINDPIHANRFSAYEWLGRAKAKEGRLPLEKKIEVLLDGEVNSLKQSEMTACAESLAKIGDINSALSIRKVCYHLAYWVYMSYRPIEEGRSGSGSDQISTLFKAHHALATLGFKDEALSRLKELETKCLKEMEHSIQEEFLRELESAEKW